MAPRRLAANGVIARRRPARRPPGSLSWRWRHEISIASAWMKPCWMKLWRNSRRRRIDISLRRDNDPMGPVSSGPGIGVPAFFAPFSCALMIAALAYVPYGDLLSAADHGGLAPKPRAVLSAEGCAGFTKAQDAKTQSPCAANRRDGPHRQKLSAAAFTS
jgi:hypothetical protein